MDCPRCGSEHDVYGGFCWFCGWDFNKDPSICDKCGLTVGDNEDCSICGPNSTAEREDWDTPDEDND
jgi:predicted amidophosphoribosyltransferase